MNGKVYIPMLSHLSPADAKSSCTRLSSVPIIQLKELVVDDARYDVWKASLPPDERRKRLHVGGVRRPKAAPLLAGRP